MHQFHKFKNSFKLFLNMGLKLQCAIMKENMLNLEYPFSIAKALVFASHNFRENEDIDDFASFKFREFHLNKTGS